MTLRGIALDPLTKTPILVLGDVDSGKVLPLGVGLFEANAVALEQEQTVSHPPGGPSPRVGDGASNAIALAIRVNPSSSLRVFALGTRNALRS